ncbi:MAG: DMT family protein [Pseudobdellovibrio sp.]|uniref:DMT family protein n=1 Tax=Pseudobdellovibrio sp. HCB154 TaxID=3386277 RepID=UPI00391731AF|nr:DMT family protein [Pseudobdellovibrio sp.]
MNLSAAYPLLLLVISNIFMTYAWYGHLKTMKDSPIWIVILASWGIAFFEYVFQVPANRWGFEYYSLPQLKILQEVITILVFIFFSTFYMNQSFKWDYLWAGLCMVGAVYFVFK